MFKESSLYILWMVFTAIIIATSLIFSHVEKMNDCPKPEGKILGYAKITEGNRVECVPQYELE